MLWLEADAWNTPHGLILATLLNIFTLLREASVPGGWTLQTQRSHPCLCPGAQGGAHSWMPVWSSHFCFLQSPWSSSLVVLATPGPLQPCCTILSRHRKRQT